MMPSRPPASASMARFWVTADGGSSSASSGDNVAVKRIPATNEPSHSIGTSPSRRSVGAMTVAPIRLTSGWTATSSGCVGSIGSAFGGQLDRHPGGAGLERDAEDGAQGIQHLVDIAGELGAE